MSRISEILDGFNTTVKIVKKMNPDKSGLAIKCDLIKNMMARPISFPDYRKCNFINISEAEKDECINKKEYEKFVYYMDKEPQTNIFVDKIEFNTVFKDYIGRDFIDIRKVGKDGLKEFVQGKESVFAKEIDGCGGHGIEKLNDFSDIDTLYSRLMKNKQFLIEDTLIQHEILNKINPNAVNNVRYATVVKDGKVYIETSTLRLNTGKDAVISSNDVMVNIDEEGNLISDAIDEMFDTYETHPDTGTKLKGIKLPDIPKAREMVKKAALLVPEVRYVGWDVALTSTGPVLIEGNFYPSYGLTQFYLLNPDFHLKRRLKNILGDEWDKSQE